MKVVLIGSGNVATHLGYALAAAGHDVIQVWSRTLEHALDLASVLSAAVTDSMNELSPIGDIYILSVPDDAIRDVAAAFPFRDKLIVHTSGTTGLEILEGVSSMSGVFYPLQTFSKQKGVNFREIPVVVEGSSDELTETLLAFAESISGTVYAVDSEKRKVLHLAAVIACNFSNHLYALAEKILQEEQLDFNLIRPLIRETADKAMLFSPAEVQTGPARRKDMNTIRTHLSLLEKDENLYQIYRLLSEDILRG
ncbi:Rossmann-like and DUF2520 domain-containing protein, partial [Pararcticibacter amylolyticus]